MPVEIRGSDLARGRKVRPGVCKLPPPQDPAAARIVPVELAKGRRVATTTRQDEDQAPSGRAAQATAQCALLRLPVYLSGLRDGVRSSGRPDQARARHAHGWARLR